jgi:hypothetical protein
VTTWKGQISLLEIQGCGRRAELELVRIADGAEARLLPPREIGPSCPIGEMIMICAWAGLLLGQAGSGAHGWLDA